MPKSIGLLFLFLVLWFPRLGYAGCELEFISVLSEPYFWRITKDRTVSHVLGTIHSGVSLAEMPDFVMGALRVHKTFLFEGGLLSAPPSLPLLSRLKKKETERVREFLRFRFPSFPETVEGLLPSLSPSSVYVFMNMTEPQFIQTITHHMDQEVLAALGQRRVKVQSLDTEQNLNKALQDLDEERLSQIRALIARPRGRRFSKEQIFKWPGEFDVSGFVEAYRTSTMEKFFVSQKSDKLENSLLRDRRLDWLDAIEAAHENGGSFITGGVAHFIHPRYGLLKALHQNGYSIQRMVVPPDLDFVCVPSNQAFVLSYSKLTDLISVNYRNRQLESFPIDEAVKAVDWDSGETSLIYKFGDQQTLTIKSELNSGEEAMGQLDLGDHSFHIQLSCRKVD